MKRHGYSISIISLDAHLTKGTRLWRTVQRKFSMCVYTIYIRNENIQFFNLYARGNLSKEDNIYIYILTVIVHMVKIFTVSVKSFIFF